MKLLKIISITTFAVILFFAYTPVKLTTILLELTVGLCRLVCEICEELFQFCGTLADEVYDGK